MNTKILKVLSAALSVVLSGILIFNMSVCYVYADDSSFDVDFPVLENVYIGDDNHFYCTYDGIEYRSNELVYSSSSLSIRTGSHFYTSDHTFNYTVYDSFSFPSGVTDVRTCVFFDTVNLCFGYVSILVPYNSFINSVIFDGARFSIYYNDLRPNSIFGFSYYHEPSKARFESTNYRGYGWNTYLHSSFYNQFSSAGVKSFGFSYRYWNYSGSGSSGLYDFTNCNNVPIWFNGGDFWGYHKTDEPDKLTNLPMGSFMFNYIFWDPTNRTYTYLTSSSALAALEDNKFVFSEGSSYKVFYSITGSSWLSVNNFGFADSVDMDPEVISTDHILKLVYTNDSFNVVNDKSVFPDRLTELDLAFRPLTHAPTANVYYDYDFAKEAFNSFYAVTYMGRDSHNIYTVYYDGARYTFPGAINSSKDSIPNYVYMTYGVRDVNFSANAQYFIGFSMTTLFSSEVLREECVLMDYYECWGNKYYFGYLTDNLTVLNKSIISQYDSLRALYDRLDYTNYLISENQISLAPIVEGINSLGSKLDELISVGGSSGSGVDLSGVDSTLNSINTKLGSILGFLVVDEIVDDFFDDIQDIIPDPDEVSLSGLVSFLTSSSALLMSGGLLTGIFSNIDTDGMSEASQYITLFWGYLGPFKALILVPVAFSVAHLVIRKEGIG